LRLSPWRQFTRAYAALLSWLLLGPVAIPVIPVSLQIFSLYTALIPSMLLVLAIVVVWPKLSLWLPGLISREFLR